MAEAARASYIRRRALIGSWVTPPTTSAIEIERGGDENITINHGCRQGEAGRQAARRRQEAAGRQAARRRRRAARRRRRAARRRQGAARCQAAQQRRRAALQRQGAAGRHFIKTNRTRRCLRRGDGVGRLGWGVRGSIAAAWDVSGVAMVSLVKKSPGQMYCIKAFPRRFRLHQGHPASNKA